MPCVSSILIERVERELTTHGVFLGQEAASIDDFCAKAFVPGPAGKQHQHQLLVTLHTANRAMDDVRQPLDNPFLAADEKALAAEVARYRVIAAGRQARDAEAQAKKPRLRLELRLLSGETRTGQSTLVAKNYEELQRAFVAVVPFVNKCPPPPLPSL